jgi:calcium permeable stress-gated cation channel
MYDKWLEVHPKDIVWENLSESAVATRSRTVVSWLATMGLILVWVFPVGFVGTLSNVSALCQKVR